MNLETIKSWLSFRNRTKPITTVVLHATAGSTAVGAISTLVQKQLSYHYIIEDQRETDGKVIKCVPYNKVAFHAGKSKGPDGPNVNEYSIGISFVNSNTGNDPYSQKQYNAALELLTELFKAIPTLSYLTTHYWVSPLRKSDPRGFPVDKLARDVSALVGRTVTIWNDGRGILPGEGIK